MNLFDKILLCNYSLSVVLSRKKKEKYEEGTWFLMANELFFLLCSVCVYFLGKTSYYFSKIEIFLPFIILWLFCFYGTKKWLMYRIKTKNIKQQYKSLKGKTAVYSLCAVTLFCGAFVYMFIAFVYMADYITVITN